MEKKRRLVMIEPGAPGDHIYSAMKLPRIGAVLLGTIATHLGWEVKVFVEDIAPIDYKEVLSADLVGISTITSTASKSYAIADAVSKEGIPVVMGGPHVTFQCEEALEYCDFVVRGEGEVAFPMLLEHISTGARLDQIPNLSYRAPDRSICHNPMGEALEDLDSLPWPDYTLIEGWSLIKTFSQEPIVPIQATRGCPFGCNFCCVINMFGRKMRFRSVEDVLGEIEQYRDEGVHIFFYDDNFAANKRWTSELLIKAIERGLPWTTWSAQMRTDASRDGEFLELMREAACSNVYIGFESINPSSLKEMAKKQTVQEMRAAIAHFKEHNIDIHGMFVFGFDSDDARSVKATIDFAIESGIYSAQFLLLTPLPGTPLFDKLEREGRLLDRTWSNYDTHHVVFTPALMSPWALQWAQLEAHTRFYSPTRLLTRLLTMKFASGALYLYALMLNLDWQRKNRSYLKALEIQKETPQNMRFSFSFSANNEQVYDRVKRALF